MPRKDLSALARRPWHDSGKSFNLISRLDPVLLQHPTSRSLSSSSTIYWPSCALLAVIFSIESLIDEALASRKNKSHDGHCEGPVRVAQCPRGSQQRRF